MKDRIVQITYLLMPFAFLSMGVLHIGHKYAFLITGLVVVAFQIRNLFLRGFLIYTSAWTLFLLIKAMGSPAYNQIAGISFSMLWFFTVGAILYLAIINSKLKIESFYNLICIAAIIQSILVVFQLLGFDPILYLLTQELTTEAWLPKTTAIGTLFNNNFLSAFLAISLLFFFRTRWCWFIPVIAFILIISKTSAAVIPVFIGAGVYFWPQLKKYKYLLLIIPALCLLYALYDKGIFNADPRYALWIGAIKLLDSPAKVLFGLSPAFSYANYPIHNEWITVLCKYGVIGLSLMLGYCLTIYRGNRMLFSAFVVICINMLGNYPLQLAPSAFLIIIITALIQREASHA